MSVFAARPLRLVIISIIPGGEQRDVVAEAHQFLGEV